MFAFERARQQITNSFSVLALPSPPENLSAAGLSPFSISLSWQFNEASSLDSNISSFFVLIRKINSEAGKWDVIGVPKHVRAFNITDLQAVTTYRIRMSVAVTFSNGVGSDEILGTTLEGGWYSAVRFAYDGFRE